MSWMLVMLCGPAVIVSLAWMQFWRSHQWPARSGIIATAVATANALFGLTLYLRFRLYPTPDNVPPWKDSLVLDAGLLSLLAPIAIILGFVAKTRGAPWWLVSLIVLTSIPLFLIGCAAAASV